MKRSSSLEKRPAFECAIVHADVAGKALVLVLIFTLAMGAFFFAERMSPRETQRRAVVNALESGGDKPVAGRADSGNPVEVRGLNYQSPQGKKANSRSGTALDRARDSGRLRGYSVPPRMVAFKPDGSVVLIPPSPEVDGPRDPVVIFHGSRARKRVALTFDTSEVTETESASVLMDRLVSLRAPATFFVCGAWCYKNPDLLRAAVARGFEIASHSFSHPAFTALEDAQVASELRSTEEAVSGVSGAKISAYFRPPYGAYDGRVVQLAAQQGYATVLWDRDTVDWGQSTNQQEIRDRATVGVRGGDIIIMHTTGRYTPEALIEIVNNLRADGFELTTLTGVMQP